MDLASLATSIDTFWILITGALVFFMQAGFALVEAGFTRSKNTTNILFKNLMDFCIGTIVFWLVGYGLMFGAGNGLIGALEPFSEVNHAPAGIPNMAFFFFQLVFAATAATIVSGAMAERTKFSSYLVYSAIISVVIYPISGHWIWGGGWLAQMGFHDFAGSTVVHSVGGWLALVGAAVLGPRIGKYKKNGKANAIPGHNILIGTLGVFLLWLGWFGFNPGSTLSMSNPTLVANIFVNTNAAAAAGGIATLGFTWLKYGKPGLSMTLNGVLAGLVAITAGCDTVTPGGSILIGLMSGILVVLAVEFFDNVVKIDDPVGAISVHAVNGVFGTLMVGLFAKENGISGLFYGGGTSLLVTQLIGVAAVAAWAIGCGLVLFYILKHTIGLRVTKIEEENGLDYYEHGERAYN